MKKRGLLGLCATALVALTGPAFAADDDAAQGKAAFTKCAICHQVGPNAKTLVGPELNGIVGRKAGVVAGYNYSAGMKELDEKGYVWTEENLDKWVADPKALLPNSPMALAFPGIKDAEERARIISYLKTFPE